jgi:hypothetical protein
MKKFALSTKTGEVINIISAENVLNAAENFAELKKISVDRLLLIFDVKLFNR